MRLPNPLRTNVANRSEILEHLRQELVGPAPAGPTEAVTAQPVVEGWPAARQPRRQSNEQEILTTDRPTIRYGVGVLHPVGPLGAPRRESAPDAVPDALANDRSAVEGEEQEAPVAPPVVDVFEQGADEAESDDLDLSTANILRPGGMAISFVAELFPDSQLVIEVAGGRYEARDVIVKRTAAPAAGASPEPVGETAAPAAIPAATAPAPQEDAPSAVPEPASPADPAPDQPAAGTGRGTTWWLRHAIACPVGIDAQELLRDSANVTVRRSVDCAAPLSLEICVLSRPHPNKKNNPRQRLLTVSLTNRTCPPPRATDEACFFQAGFTVSVQNPAIQDTALSGIRPYPLPPLPPDADSDVHAAAADPPDSLKEAVRRHEVSLSREARQEEESLRLLYRNQQTWAAGHGCAADWELTTDGTAGLRVRAESLPHLELPAVTPDIRNPDGTPLSIPMKLLAGVDSAAGNGYAELEALIGSYRTWITACQDSIPALDPEHRDAATRHMEQATACADRMADGLELLREQENDSVGIAFRLANHAILLQQSRGNAKRTASFNRRDNKLIFSAPYPGVSLPDATSTRGQWRAFQIAFLLMNLRSMADPSHPERQNVELIWFPTGGGKTEAYLGLAAFSIFLRRLTNPDHPTQNKGVEVLMRYTLRLLTAQQFQRAAKLACAMEHLRRRDRNAGTGTLHRISQPFSIGIWVGRDTTPNTCQEAVTAYNAILHGNQPQTGFLLRQCPWCGAQMGEMIPHRPAPLGLNNGGGCVALICSDPACEFHQRLPVEVIDERIYASPPDILIGTVDKFAQLAWNHNPSRIFGLDDSGSRDVGRISPPGLIIQDELHLISGPLGTMVGLYEPLIEDLCTDWRDQERPIRSKIVSSTATIRRYESQIRTLYARPGVTLFPPPGLDSLDSFFAQRAQVQAVDENESKLADEQGRPSLLNTPGRIYVGVHAPSLPSLQTTQVRTFAALSSAPAQLIAKEDTELRDPWWTMLVFYNSLRELGGAVSLMQSDIPEYLKGQQRRQGFDFGRARYLNRVLELTSRISSDQVAQAISSLEVQYGSDNPKPYDYCLASNIIEVGVDIDRLSVMAVVGQPKTTSQYIQVTGRVGRRPNERPGLVVTLFSSSKPRDRSHFEKFRSYHERLYAQVEPTGLTPFSPPALDRALHAVMVGHVRQNGDYDSPDPASITEFGALLDHLSAVLQARAQLIDPATLETLKDVFARRRQEWMERGQADWGKQFGQVSPSNLMYPAGQTVGDEGRWSWAVPGSMRSVDATCELEVRPLAD